MPATLYLTVRELADYIRHYEALDQSNEINDEFVDQDFYLKTIGTASSYLDSRLGNIYPLPLPLSNQVKDLCYPIAHWWAEKQGEKREYVVNEYEAAIALIDQIVEGTAALIGTDGTKTPATSTDSSAEDGLQLVGTFVGQRRTSWTN